MFLTSFSNLLRQLLGAVDEVETHVATDAEGNDQVIAYHIEIKPNQ